jgi:hypothetical protein
MSEWCHIFTLTVWTEVSSSAPHLLHNGLLISPFMWRCILRILHVVRSSITTLECVLLKNNNLVFVAGLGTKICFWTCLWMLLRLRHCHMITNDAGQSLLSTGYRKVHSITLKIPQLCTGDCVKSCGRPVHFNLIYSYLSWQEKSQELLTF